MPGVVVGASEPGRDETLPAVVSLANGLDESEAVRIALWNSPAFQADLAQLDIARADLADAGALPNPMLTMLFPLGPHQLSGYLLLPLAALAQRPARVRAAQRDVSCVAHLPGQTGLDLIRDVRLAHADAAAAAEQARARVELVGLWNGARSWPRLASMPVTPVDWSARASRPRRSWPPIRPGAPSRTPRSHACDCGSSSG